MILDEMEMCKNGGNFLKNMKYDMLEFSVVIEEI